jgi:hypothetical protein
MTGDTHEAALSPPPGAMPRWWPVALVIATLLAYWPAVRGGWIWDDDYYVTANVTLPQR